MLRLTNWYSWSKVNGCVHFRLTKKENNQAAPDGVKKDSP